MLPVDAAIPLSSSTFKLADGCDRKDNGGSGNLSVKGSSSPGGCSTDISSIPLSPDVEQATEAADVSFPESHEDVTPTESSTENKNVGDQGRRKSHTWKNFSLKKKLSRVDQKFKSTFSSQPVVSGQGTSANRDKSSVFYYSQSTDTLQTPVVCALSETDSPVESVSISENAEKGCEITNKVVSCTKESSVDAVPVSDLNKNIDVCTQILIKSPEESPSTENSIKTPEEIGAVDNRKEETNSVTEENVSVVLNRKVSRPVDLPLFDSDGKPIRPPRKDSKIKVDRRDGRLLSVPNIMFHKPDHSLHDLRQKVDVGSNPPSFGNLMRRLSKFETKI